MASLTRSDLALLYRRAGFDLRTDELDRAAVGGCEAAVGHLLSGPGPVVSDPAPVYEAGIDITSVLWVMSPHPAFRSPIARNGLVEQPAALLLALALVSREYVLA